MWCGAAAPPLYGPSLLWIVVRSFFLGSMGVTIVVGAGGPAHRCVGYFVGLRVEWFVGLGCVPAIGGGSPRQRWLVRTWLLRWGWFCWVAEVELPGDVGGVLKIARGIPGFVGIMETGPLDSIL